VDRVRRVEPADKAALAFGLRVNPAGQVGRATGPRADPMAAIPRLLDRAENAVQAVREAQVVQADLVVVDSDLQPSHSRRNKLD